MAVRISAGRDVQAAAPREVYDGLALAAGADHDAAYGIAPDGRFLVVSPRPPAGDRERAVLRVETGWASRLGAH